MLAGSGYQPTIRNIGRRLMKVHLHQRKARGCMKRRTPRQHLEQDNPERVKVRPMVQIGISLDLFGGHIVGRPQRKPRSCQVHQRRIVFHTIFGDPKIKQLDLRVLSLSLVTITLDGFKSRWIKCRVWIKSNAEHNVHTHRGHTPTTTENLARWLVSACAP